MGPDIRESSLQFVPNSKAITTPETTPSPNATPKILSQNSKTRRYAGRPVHRCSASRTVSHAASPIVKDGKMMWNETVNANMQRRFGVAPPAQDHEVIGIGDKASAETSLKAELLPPQHKPAHVDVRQ